MNRHSLIVTYSKAGKKQNGAAWSAKNMQADSKPKPNGCRISSDLPKRHADFILSMEAATAALNDVKQGDVVLKSPDIQLCDAINNPDLVRLLRRIPEKKRGNKPEQILVSTFGNMCQALARHEKVSAEAISPEDKLLKTLTERAQSAAKGKKQSSPTKTKPGRKGNKRKHNVDRCDM